MKRINILPPEARVKASRERGLIYAVLLVLVVVVALFLGYMWQNGQVTSKQADLDRVTAEASAAQAQAAALRPYAAAETQRTQMLQTAMGLYQARVPWSTILQEISLVIPENVRLQTLTCTVPATMQAGAAAGAAAATTDVTFTGTTLSHTDVAEFMTRLGLIPQLMNVQLVSSAFSTTSSSSSSSSTSSSSTTSSTQSVTFTVTAALRPYATAPPTTTLAAAAGQ
jgi:Tfp pilus assembly protein PilN